jgi:chromosome segregation ATPase
MGVFSGGDIVIFILNLLVCVFFYLMGNSKRLEKVKKYGERLMADMKRLADSAKAPLENFKIDLEVETKAAEQLLFRLKDVRAVIAGYEDTLRHIDGRFEQFKEFLTGLDRESAAVEENLLRIRDESVFVDGVSRKITDVRKRFDALEQEIARLKESMLDTFEKANAEKLEKSASSILSATKETAEALQDEVVRKVGALAQTANTATENVKLHLDLMRKAKEDQDAAIESSIKEVNRLAEDAVKKAGERSVEYEDQLFRQLREEADGKAKAAREKIDSDWEIIRQASEENGAAISTINEEIENAKTDVRDTISRTAQEEKALWAEKLSIARDEFDLLSESVAEREGRIKAILEQIGGAEKQIETTFNESMGNAARDAAENAEKFGAEKFDIYRAALEEKLSAARNEFDLFAASTAELEGRVKAIQEQIGGEAKQIEAAFTESMENAAREAAENAEKLGAEKFNLYRAALEEEISVARAEFDQFSMSTAELEGRIKAVQEQIGGAAKQIETTFTESMGNAARDAAENAEKLGAEKFNLYRTALEEEISAFGADSNEKLEAAREKIESGWEAIRQMSGENSAALAAIREEIENAKADVRDTVSRTAGEEKALWEEKLALARNEFDQFSASAAELEGRIKVIQEQIGGAAKQIETTFTESMENAAENAEKFGAEKFNIYRAALEEKLAAARDEFDQFSASAAELEGRIKAIQEQIIGAEKQVETTFTESMENAAKEAVENAEKFGGEKFHLYRAALEEEISAFGADSDEKLKAAREKIESGWEAVRQMSEENSAALAAIREEIENAKADVRDTVSRTAGEEKALWEEKLALARNEFDRFTASAVELEGRIKVIQEQIGGAAKQIETTFTESMENAARDAAENAEKFGAEKFDRYRVALEEEISAFGAGSDEKLKEARDSVSGSIDSLNGLVQNTENEIRESVAVMKSGTDKARANIEVLAAELEALKKDAKNNLSGMIAQLEKTMADSLREKIEKLSEAQEAEFTRLDAEIGEKYRTAAEETGGKWTGEFERLKEKLDVFENALRLEMDAAGENLGVYKESMEQNMEDLRNNTELALKTEIGKITQETNERLHSQQREFEDSLESLSTDVKKRLEGTQASIDENSLKSGEALRTANENMEVAAQKIAALNAEIENAQKEMADFSEQTKLFEQADNLKVELEHKIEDMKADIEQLIQEKNMLTGMEMQFGKIRRMEEDMNTKLSRFLEEQKRMDIMESDFNRLVKMSGDIEDKLKSISAENDMLEQIQVRLRKLSEAADISEEKYQRVENRNNIIDTTNAGISLNLKKLEDAEHRLEARQADIKNIDKEISSLKDALAKIKFENGEALEISRALSTLDTSLAEIEGRIERMETAREWLAAVETRMAEMQRNTMENISRIDDKTKRNLGGTRETVNVLSPSIQDDVRRLKHEGWSIENIAKNYKLSIGEVQLILEKTPL